MFRLVILFELSTKTPFFRLEYFLTVKHFILPNAKRQSQSEAMKAVVYSTIFMDSIPLCCPAFTGASELELDHMLVDIFPTFVNIWKGFRTFANTCMRNFCMRNFSHTILEIFR